MPGPPGEAPPIPLDLLIEHSKKSKRHLAENENAYEEDYELKEQLKKVSPKLKHYDKFKGKWRML